MPSDPDLNNLDDEPYLDLPEGGSEELESEVRKARAELDDLRRRQEQIEKEKLRLEDLSRRQEDLEVGRADIVGKLERALSLIHREAEECQQRFEQLQLIGRNFKEHLKELEDVQPRQWSAAEAPKELTKGTAAVEEARAEYAKAQARIAIEAPESQSAAEMLDYEQEPDKSFSYWFLNGLAFTLPLQILGIIALLIWIWSTFTSR